MATPFDFLRDEFAPVHGHAVRAGADALRDARTSCFYARLAIEAAVTWAFDHDRSLKRPYDSNLSALLHEPSFKDQMPQAVFLKAREAIRLGNRAAHEGTPLSNRDAVTAVSHLWEFTYWFGRTYIRGTKPEPGLKFDPASLPRPGPSPATTAARIRELEAEAAANAAALQRERELAEENAALAAEIERLRADVEIAKARASAVPDDHDYSESETRDLLIDLALREAGWSLDAARDREFEVTGMPSESGKGRVDYVLWGDDGAPLALVEAKRTRRDATVGQHQAKLYADALEAMYGRRPVIFYSNGFETWVWDDTVSAPRQTAGFRTRDELQLMVQRRDTRRRLADIEVDADIAGRFYQERAIRRICESFEEEHQRKALVVMATGAGKTRTVIALADVLIRANWAKRVLFLADRTALVNQAANAFTSLLADTTPVNLLNDRNGEGRVYVSTYATMMNLIDSTATDGTRRFGPGHFDLVVIDEAHRSVFNKYRAIFEYFDSYLVGLTATPKSEIDRNTYDLFDLETGVPTDEYGLADAVDDGFLVPLRAVSVPLKFQREGIRYDELSDDEKDAWDDIDWDEDDDPPDEVGAEAINRWLFNADTIDKVLAHVMTNGVKTEDGARLAKTIVFAKNQRHADFIAQRFDANYPHYRGHFARVITTRTEYAQDLIGKFSIGSGDPRIAISVDMLDTGIDVPEVANLVFFKIVRSKTKFWQMIGRGTRLCPDLFGPGRDKDSFCVFDFCQNLEYFGQNPDGGDTPAPVPITTRLFHRRLDVIEAIDRAGGALDLRQALTDILRSEVGAMNTESFVVRPHRREVERFREPEAWASITESTSATLRTTLAVLPTEVEAERIESKQFDLVMLNAQLALLTGEPAIERIQRQVRAIASILEDHSRIPAIAAELGLIHDLQTDEWWTDVTLQMIESARRRLRLLVALIEKRRRAPLYTNFSDDIGEGVEVDLGIGGTDDFAQFRSKATAFMREHNDHLAIQRLRRNQPITESDLTELARMLFEVRGGSEVNVQRASVETGGLGLFVRSLVGMDRSAAKDAFAGFLDERVYSGNQIEYVNLVIDHLANDGVVEPRRFYESPYTDVAPAGPDGVFSRADVERFIGVVHEIRATATAETG